MERLVQESRNGMRMRENGSKKLKAFSEAESKRLSCEIKQCLKYQFLKDKIVPRDTQRSVNDLDSRDCFMSFLYLLFLSPTAEGEETIMIFACVSVPSFVCSFSQNSS